MYNDREYQYLNLNGSGTTQVFSGKGILHAIVINTVDNGTIKIIDGISGSTANVGTIRVNSSPFIQPTPYDTTIATGLRLVITASPDITVAYTTG